MDSKTKKIVGVGLLLIGAAALTYALVIKPRKERTSNAIGRPASGAAKVRYDSCGGKCGTGQRCVKGVCL